MDAWAALNYENGTRLTHALHLLGRLRGADLLEQLCHKTSTNPIYKSHAYCRSSKMRKATN